jgi:catechol 2,3-dioxygenase
VPIQHLGHVVLKVRNLARAERFYHDVLGLPIATRSSALGMIFFTLGDHHDFAIMQIGDDAPPADPAAPGLFHVAFNIGNTIDELRSMKARLQALGVTLDRIEDHTVSQSLYLNDPDGNGIELYVDTSDSWKYDRSLVATVKPLAI